MSYNFNSHITLTFKIFCILFILCHTFKIILCKIFLKKKLFTASKEIHEQSSIAKILPLPYCQIKVFHHLSHEYTYPYGQQASYLIYLPSSNLLSQKKIIFIFLQTYLIYILKVCFVHYYSLKTSDTWTYVCIKHMRVVFC